jgi:hypothetical protein
VLAVARRHLALAALVAAGSALITGCGGGEERVALAIDEARRSGGTVELSTECASSLEVQVRPDPAGSGLAQVSLWGRPELGRCTATIALDELPADATKLVDATTSQVVEIQPA